MLPNGSGTGEGTQLVKGRGGDEEEEAHANFLNGSISFP